jgi:dipeptidyl aminopeptidase/acylaminoacyl peptidase
MKIFLVLFLSAVATAFSGGGASAATEPLTAPIPAIDFARAPTYSDVQFAPSGARFAAVQIVDGRRNLTVGDLEKGTLTRVTSFTTYDIAGYQWISDKRLVLSLYDAQKGLAEQRGGGLFAVDFDGGDARELSPVVEKCASQSSRVCRQTRLVRRIPGGDDQIIASANERDLRTADLYRLDTRSGKKVLLTERVPPHVVRWVLDTNGIPRAAMSSDGKTRTGTFWFRDRAEADWRQISKWVGEAPHMEPAAFDSDGSLLVISNLGSDKFQLYEFDAAAGKPGKLVLASPTVDLEPEDIIAPPALGFKVAGVRIDADKPETVWFDDKYSKVQALLDSSLPKGNVNVFNILNDGKVSVISYSDREPGQYYLYDPAKKQLEEVLRPREWIDPKRMSTMTVVRYKARDGLEIPAYLTVPNGKPATKLPLVAVIHGGPWARDHWGFNPDVQFLASRGYAVLQPNYRGSEGFGRRHLESGFKQLGESMQDDITDGIRYLVDKGIVDPDRVCIDGGSYGGYATMMALIKEPDMFKCGIDEAGVIDLFWWHELGFTDYNRIDSEAAEEFLKIRVGDTSVDRELLRKNSPRLHADKVKAPVMIIHAVRDQRVPFQHAEAMRAALQAAGKSVEWVVYPDEAHGFIKVENRVDRYNKIEAFLRKNLGP